MRSLSIQIQPERSPGIDIQAIEALFRSLADRIDLVRHHAFAHGDDDGPYYNFTFGSERPGDLWRLIRSSIFEAPEHRDHLAACAMAMCSSEGGWHRYTQLHHWDPGVPVEAWPAL